MQRLQLLSRSPMVSDLKFSREPRHAVVLLHSLGSKGHSLGSKVSRLDQSLSAHRHAGARLGVAVINYKILSSRIFH